MVKSGDWTTRELVKRLLLPGNLSNQAFIELQVRYYGIAVNIGNSIGYDRLGSSLEDFLNWIWPWMIDKRKLKSFCVTMLKVTESVSEEEHRKIAGGYLKKVIFSGKHSFIDEQSLSYSLDVEKSEEEIFGVYEMSLGVDGTKTQFHNVLGELKARDRIVVSLAFFTAIDRLEFSEDDWKFLCEHTGKTEEELNAAIDSEVIGNSGKALFPVSGEFIANLLNLSTDNVYKIKARFKNALKKVLEVE